MRSFLTSLVTRACVMRRLSSQPTRRLFAPTATSSEMAAYLKRPSLSMHDRLAIVATGTATVGLAGLMSHDALVRRTTPTSHAPEEHTRLLFDVRSILLPHAHAESPNTADADDASNPSPPNSSSADKALSIGLSRYAVADAVDKVLPSVVNIRRVSTTRVQRGLFGLMDGGGFGLGFGGGGVGAEPPESIQVSCGSGFFINSEGLIMTNAHVVAPTSPFSPDGEPLSDNDEDSVLHVTTSDGEVYVGRIVAVDEASDIALIKINAQGPTPAADMGDSDDVRPGEFVVAVGSPLTLSNSVSFGIISMIRRDLFQSHSPAPPPAPHPLPLPHPPQQPSPPSLVPHEPGPGGDTLVKLPENNSVASGLTYLQLDVAINQGSSGGPCVSLDGRVIGMCSMKLAGDAEGIAFAIPIRYASRVVSDLQTYGYVRRPYVGLTLISVTPQLFDDIRQDTSYRPPRWLESHMRRINTAKSVGLMVHHISPGGPGDRAGLQPGDVVIGVNGQSTTTTSEFLAALAFNVHKDCTLTVRRAATGRPDEITIRPEVLNAPDRNRGRGRNWRGR